MKILKLMKGLVKYLIFMVIFSVIQVVCELYLPNIMSDVVDKGIATANTSFIIKEGFYMFLVTIVALLANIIVVYCTSKFSNNYGFHIRDALYKKINSFSKREIDQFGASTLITRSTNNVSNITSTFSFGLRIVIFAPIMGIGAAVMGYSKAAKLAPTVIIAVLVLMLGIGLIFGVVLPKFNRLQQLLDKLNSSTREVLSGLRVIKSFNKEKYFSNRFDKVNSENRDLNIFLNKILYLVQPLMMLTIDISTVVIVYISTKYLGTPDLELGSMMHLFNICLQYLLVS